MWTIKLTCLQSGHVNTAVHSEGEAVKKSRGISRTITQKKTSQSGGNASQKDATNILEATGSYSLIPVWSTMSRTQSDDGRLQTGDVATTPAAHSTTFEMIYGETI